MRHATPPESDEPPNDSSSSGQETEFGELEPKEALRRALRGVL
jgi:hypothetical protein